jgi:hypothetical protein
MRNRWAQGSWWYRVSSGTPQEPCAHPASYRVALGAPNDRTPLEAFCPYDVRDKLSKCCPAVNCDARVGESINKGGGFLNDPVGRSRHLPDFAACVRGR